MGTTKGTKEAKFQGDDREEGLTFRVLVTAFPELSSLPQAQKARLGGKPSG
jgi:hypothetical protein